MKGLDRMTTSKPGFGVRFGAVVLLAVVLAACSSPTRNRAPVEERAPTTRTPAGAVAAPVAAAAGATATPAGSALPGAEAPPRLPPGAENAGKPGYYTVRPGDTLIRIGLETGQNWRDIVRWNNLDNPNLIEVGQVLRVARPTGNEPSAAAVATVPVAEGGVVTRPVAPPAAVASGALPAPATRPASAPATAAAPPTPPAPAAAPASSPPAGAGVGLEPFPAQPAARAGAREVVGGPPPAQAPAAAPASSAAAGEDEPGFIWPAAGTVVAPFDDPRNKGIGIAGKAGDAVVASADGRVVYAGAGLRGYGNLIILKHNNTYLTAYAHNQTLLVKEDQTVRKGQKIAEMGSSDADRVKLHFEVRRQGKPVDPLKHLPTR